jgi:hypothetical protein
MPPLRPYATAATLTPIELERQIPLIEAARLVGVSVKTLDRHYPHLIRRPSPRRKTMKLRDVLAIGQAQS